LVVGEIYMLEIRYYSKVIDLVSGVLVQSLLGMETFSGVVEALIPGWVPGRTVFYTKRFHGVPHHYWRVEEVFLASGFGLRPVIYNVVLSYSAPSYAEEYLYQTLKKDPAKTAFKILRKGTLVEVDYGFHPDVGRLDGVIKSNKRYSDTLLHGEMHKRRLAVVVKVVSKNLIQVAPVTSKGSVGDKSEFQLSQATIDRLPRYKDSGYSSYVLCNRLEAVSTQRILPPLSYHKAGSGKGRYTSYPVVLTSLEMVDLKASMLTAIGVTDYSSLHLLKASEKQVENQKAKIESLEEKIKFLSFEGVVLAGLSQEWASILGMNYADELAFRRELEAENLVFSVDASGD
jgi:uncharacterized protein YifN (PemK superfamily)